MMISTSGADRTSSLTRWKHSRRIAYLLKLHS